MIKAILFDFDDTLTRTKDTRWAAYIETGKKFYNMEITGEELEKYWGTPFEELLHKIFKDKEPIEEVRRKYLSVAKNHPLVVYPGAQECIIKLAEKFLIGIVTSSPKDLMIWDLEDLKFPMDKIFDLQTEEDTQVHKPDPRVFEPVFKKLSDKGINKSEIVYVGDLMRDYNAAIGAGIGFVGITHGMQLKKDYFEKAGATYVDNFEELIEFFTPTGISSPLGEVC